MPLLVRFELAPEPVDDRLQLAQLISTLASAGYRAKEDDVAELMNMRFTAANMNPTDLYATKAVGYVPTMEAMQTRLGMPLKPAPSDAPAPITNTAGADAEPVLNSWEGNGTSDSAPAELRRDGEVPCSDGIVANANSDLEDASDSEPPLNDGELAALRALGGELNPAQVAADAEYAAKEMEEGLKEEKD